MMNNIWLILVLLCCCKKDGCSSCHKDRDMGSRCGCKDDFRDNCMMDRPKKEYCPNQMPSVPFMRENEAQSRCCENNIE